MDVNAMRVWGMWVSAGVMLAALAVAAPWRASTQTPDVRELYQLAQGDAPASTAAPDSFIVRFRGAGPIARAQALAARGRDAQAARQVQAQLARQGAFSGLCFDRFTVGGAEVVLRSCADISPAERAAFQTRWLARLNAMRAVEYADANVAAAPTRGG